MTPNTEQVNNLIADIERQPADRRVHMYGDLARAELVKAQIEASRAYTQLTRAGTFAVIAIAVAVVALVAKQVMA